jgi:phage gp36-like protein
MAAYATIYQFRDAFGQESIELSSLDYPDDDAEQEEVLNRALEDASAVIDTYIAGRYPVPLPAAPIVLIPYCLDIARYRLWRNTDAPEDVRKRYEDAIRWLEMLAKGTVKLVLPQVLPTDPPIAPTSGPHVQYDVSRRRFPGAKLSNLF